MKCARGGKRSLIAKKLHQTLSCCSLFSFWFFFCLCVRFRRAFVPPARFFEVPDSTCIFFFLFWQFSDAHKKVRCEFEFGRGKSGNGTRIYSSSLFFFFYRLPCKKQNKNRKKYTLFCALLMREIQLFSRLGTKNNTNKHTQTLTRKKKVLPHSTKKNNQHASKAILCRAYHQYQTTIAHCGRRIVHSSWRSPSPYHNNNVSYQATSQK